MKKNRLSHALLFVGDDRSEKERIAADLLSQMNVRFVKLESENGADIKVDQIRDLTSGSPSLSWIIPQAELLNKQASNALLKTLEEPRGNQFFILIAPSTRSILPTLVSRCQRINIPSVSRELDSAQAPTIPENCLERLELIENLVKSKSDLQPIFTVWNRGASLEFKEKLFQALQDLDKHVSPQLILERLLL
jgi:DNA polymerase III delta prime subunit